MAERYKGYSITQVWRSSRPRYGDWTFAHDEYDGAPVEPFGAPADPRCGAGATLAECKREIDEIEAELAEDAA